MEENQEKFMYSRMCCRKAINMDMWNRCMHMLTACGVVYMNELLTLCGYVINPTNQLFFCFKENYDKVQFPHNHWHNHKRMANEVNTSDFKQKTPIACPDRPVMRNLLLISWIKLFLVWGDCPVICGLEWDSIVTPFPVMFSSLEGRETQ